MDVIVCSLDEFRQILAVDVRAPVRDLRVAVLGVITEQVSQMRLDDHSVRIEIPLPHAHLAGEPGEPKPLSGFRERDAVLTTLNGLNQQSDDQSELQRDQHEQRNDPTLIELPKR